MYLYYIYICFYIYVKKEVIKQNSYKPRGLKNNTLLKISS